MPRGKLKRDWRSVSRELLGDERDRVIREHLEWQAARGVREAIEIPTDYPLASWARDHSARLAAGRAERSGYYRNSKVRSRGRGR